MSKQVPFDFVEVMDRELAEEAERKREYWRKANAAAILKGHVDDMPPSGDEWDVILMGIRLCRHVHDYECHECNLDTENHCPDTLPWHWYHDQYCPTKVCLKDYFSFCKRIGRKDLIRNHLRL